MIKKMTVSIVFMSVFFLTGFMLYILVVEESGESSADSLNEMMSGDFADEDYVFHLNDDAIQSKAENAAAGKYSLTNYTLEPNDEANMEEQVAFAYAELPSLTVKQEASLQYELYETIPAAEELHEKLSDEILPVHIRFYDNGAYFHDVEVKQAGEKINGTERINLAEGAKGSILFETEELDFSEPLTIHVTDQADAAAQLTYQIDWEQFDD